MILGHKSPETGIGGIVAVVAEPESILAAIDRYHRVDSEVEEQERTIRSAKKLGFQIKDDPDAAWYPVLKRLSDEEVETAFRLSLKNGRSIFYSGVLSVGDSPSVEQNKTMLLQVDMAILSAGVSRY